MRQMDVLDSKTEYPKSKRTLVRSARFTYHVLLSWKYCLHIFPTPWKGEALWWWLWLRVGWHQNWQMRELLQADHAHHSTHSTRGSTISFHPWNAFHTGCRVELGGHWAGRSGGDGNGDWPSLFWAPPSLFPSFHLNSILSKVSISVNFYSSSKLFKILTLWCWEGWFDKVGYWTGFWDNYLPVKDPHPNAPSYHQSFFLPRHCASPGSSLAPHLILAPTIPAFPTIMPPNKRATHHHRIKPAGGSDGLLCLQWGIFYTNFGLLSCQGDLFYTNFLVQVACGVKMVTHTIDRNHVIEFFTKYVDQSCIQDSC